MTHAEKRLLVESAARIASMEKRLDALCQIFEILLERKAGRPSAAEVERLEELKGQVHGAHH